MESEIVVSRLDPERHYAAIIDRRNGERGFRIAARADRYIENEIARLRSDNRCMERRGRFRIELELISVAESEISYRSEN